MTRTASPDAAPHHPRGFSPQISRAVRARDIGAVRRLVAAQGPGLLQRTRADGSDVLHLAVEADDPGLIRELLSLGAQAEPPGRKVEPPIMYAARIGHHRALRALLPTSTATSRRTLALHALEHDQPGVLHALLNAGLAPADFGDCYITLLRFAAETGQHKGLRLLIDGGFALEHRDRLGRTALHSAAAHAQPEAVAVLLDAGADPCARDDHGNIPADLVGRYDPDITRSGQCQRLFAAKLAERLLRERPIEASPRADDALSTPSL